MLFSPQKANDAFKKATEAEISKQNEEALSLYEKANELFLQAQKGMYTHTHTYLRVCEYNLYSHTCMHTQTHAHIHAHTNIHTDGEKLKNRVQAKSQLCNVKCEELKKKLQIHRLDY